MQALAGFKPSGLAEAIELMQGCKDESAVAALETALQQRDVQRLESAINEAQALSRPVSRMDLLDEATRLCAELKDQAAASALRTALEQRDVRNLERAIARGEALSLAGRKPALLVEAVRMHEELKVAEVSGALKKAVASGDVDELGRAVTAATRFPAFMARNEEAVQQARGHLKFALKMELKSAIRTLDPEELQGVLAKLRAAPLEPDRELETSKNKANEILSSLLARRTQKIWDTGDNDKTAATGELKFDPMKSAEEEAAAAEAEKAANAKAKAEKAKAEKAKAEEEVRTHARAHTHTPAGLDQGRVRSMIHIRTST